MHNSLKRRGFLGGLIAGIASLLGLSAAKASETAVNITQSDEPSASIYIKDWPVENILEIHDAEGKTIGGIDSKGMPFGTLVIMIELPAPEGKKIFANKPIDRPISFVGLDGNPTYKVDISA